MPLSNCPPGYVTLEGDADLFRRSEIVAALPDPSAVSSILVNCIRATYVDSSIIGLMVGLRRQFVDAGGDPDNFIMIVAKNSVVDRAFGLAGVNKLFAMAFVETQARVSQRV